MSTSPSSRLAVRRFRLMSARSVKRWARKLTFVWFGMWLSTALLPCSEVLAAVAAYEQALGADCGHPADSAPAHGSGHKTASCLNIDEQTPASTESLIALVGGKLKASLPFVSASVHIVPSLSVPSLLPVYRAAPPPLAHFLRSSRLLI